jgi:hypothetical protein
MGAGDMTAARVRFLALLLAAFAAPLCAGATFGAFSATTSNPTSNFSAASNFCLSPGSQTVTTDGDAWVNEAAPGQNHDLAVKLDVRSSTAGGRRRAYVHFALPTAPHNCDLTSATLRLTTTTLGLGATIAAYQAAAAWGETTVKWNAQPGSTGAASTASAAAGVVSWTVTGQVQAMYSGTNTGFVLIDANESSADIGNAYASRETGAGAPELTVTFG